MRKAILYSGMMALILALCLVALGCKKAAPANTEQTPASAPESTTEQKAETPPSAQGENPAEGQATDYFQYRPGDGRKVTVGNLASRADDILNRLVS